LYNRQYGAFFVGKGCLMPRITLNTYLQEVASLIDREARDEAIGHCKHILESFPKHLKTYHLLGKALYERSLTTDAADVFKRILAAVPDDREAHLYLCEIYSETDPNASIFHLERVWEHSPEDAAIQDELRKLYAKRDGEAPPAIQMTTPALARRYFNGRLYAEAAAELEKLLERFPERHDLRGLLAQTLWADDRPDEATEVALQVLAELPDHLEANRIMATLWLLMQRPSDARPFVNRLQALDPYLAWKVVYGEDVRVPENAFLLDRLDWRAKSAALALDVSGMGEVFSSLDALTLSDSSLPDYTAAPKPATGRLAQAFRQSAPESDLPDWLDDAPQTAAAFAMPDWSQDYAEQTDDVPDWLADDAPASRPPAAADWLADDDFAADIPQAEWLIDDVPDSAPAADLPDWLSDAPQPSAAAPADDPLDAMAWLMTGTPTQPTDARPQAAVGTDFAADLDFESRATASSAPAAEPVPSLESDFDFGMFDAAVTPDLSAESAESAPVADLPAAEGEDSAFTLDWLSGAPDLSAESAESAERVESAPAAEGEDSAFTLDWLSGAPDLSAESAESVESAPAAEGEDSAFTLDWLSGTPDLSAESAESVVESAPAAEGEDSAFTLDWLSSTPDLSAESAERVETAPAAEGEDSAFTLDWLSGTPDLSAESAESVVESAPAAEGEDSAFTLDWLSGAPDLSAESAERVESAPAAEGEDSAFTLDWLSGAPDLSAESAESAERVESAPAAEGEDSAFTLDWLSGAPDLSAESAESAERVESAPAAEGEDSAFTLDWLSGAPDLSAESAESAPVADLPAAEGEDSAFTLDWLSGAPDLSAESAESAPVADLPDFSMALGAETDDSPVGLDWLAAPIEGDDQAPDSLDWLADEPVQADAMPALEDSELAAIEADPLAWMADFGLSPVPEPSAPQADLDAADLAEFEAQRASTGDLAAFEGLPEAERAAEGTPQSMAQIAGEMTAEAMLAWLQENTPTPEQIEAEGRAMLSSEADDEALFALPRLTPAAAELPAPDSIELEDDWLTSFESGATQPPPLSAPPAAPSSAPDWLETQPEADEFFADSPEWLIGAEQSTGQTGLLAAEADHAFDQLLEQARNAANTPRKTGDTGILSPGDAPDWLSAFDADAPLDEIEESAAAPQAAEWLSESLADLALPALEALPEPDGLPELITDTPAETFASDWLGESSEQTVESVLADLWDSAPLASSADLADTTEAPPSTAETEDEPLTFTFRKPPVWKRKRSSGAE
jgi:tetratricopeptide (TPR) repeat protein